MLALPEQCSLLDSARAGKGDVMRLEDIRPDSVVRGIESEPVARVPRSTAIQSNSLLGRVDKIKNQPI